MFAVRRALLASFVLVGAFLTQASLEPPPVTNLHPTGAGRSIAYSINSSGQCVGSAVYEIPGEYSTYICRAILWNPDGTIESLDPSDSYESIEAHYITDSGFVLGAINFNEGFFLWDSEGGFRVIPVLQDASATTVDQYPTALGEDGSVAGVCQYWSAEGNWTGAWLYRNGDLEELDVEGSFDFYPKGFTSDGSVFGFASGAGYNCSVLLHDGEVTLLSIPGDQREPLARNSSGQTLLSGAWDDPVLREEGGTMVPLNLVGPGSYFGEDWTMQVAPLGLDEDGRVLGWAYKDWKYYLWAWDAGEVLTHELPWALSHDKPRTNRAGMMAGVASQTFSYTGFVWDPFGSGFTVLPALHESLYAYPIGINDIGQIVGVEVNDDGDAFYAVGWNLQAPSVLTVSDAVVSKKGKTLSVTVTISNPGADVARNVTLSSATLAGVATNTTLPVYDTLKPGASKKCTLQFKGIDSGEQSFIINGTCSQGSFYRTQNVTIP